METKLLLKVSEEKSPIEERSPEQKYGRLWHQKEIKKVKYGSAQNELSNNMIKRNLSEVYKPSIKIYSFAKGVGRRVVTNYTSLLGFHGSRIALKYNKRYFSSESVNNKLHPWFITGFTDAEGCFYIGLEFLNE